MRKITTFLSSASQSSSRRKIAGVVLGPLVLLTSVSLSSSHRAFASDETLSDAELRRLIRSTAVPLIPESLAGPVEIDLTQPSVLCLELNSAEAQASQSQKHLAVCLPAEDLALAGSDPAQPDKKIHRFLIEQSNDMSPADVVSRWRGRDDILSDDVGRTFGGRIMYEREDENRLRRYELRTDLFSRRVTQDGKKRDAKGHLYLETYELTSFTVTEGLKINRNDTVLIEGQVEGRTGKAQGWVGQPLQSAWHDNVERKDSLIYHYLDDKNAPPEIVASIAAGMRRLLETDVRQFHFAAAGTVLTGLNTQGRPLLKTRIEGQMSTGTWGGRSVENPYLALSAWREDLIQHLNRRSEMGLRVQTSFKTRRGIRVVPFYAIVRNNSAEDRTYSSGTRYGRESVHTIGLLVEY